jgi:hypothetical protein
MGTGERVRADGIDETIGLNAVFFGVHVFVYAREQLVSQ